MKFQTKIIGIPAEVIINPGETPTISKFPNQNISQTFWLTDELGQGLNDASGAQFDINLKGTFEMNKEIWHDAEIKINDKYLSIQSFGPILSSTPTNVAIISQDNILDNGVFVISNIDGTLFLANGIVSSPDKACGFYFTWRSIVVSKELVRLYLRARYYLDNKAELLTSQDYVEDVQKIVTDLGNAIIAQSIGGNRAENIYFESADYTKHSGAMYGMFSNDVNFDIDENIFGTTASLYNGNGAYYTNNQSKNSTGILYQGGVNVDDNVSLDDWRHQTQRVPKKDDGTPEFQRAVTDNNSDDIVDKFYKSTIYSGIIKNSNYTLNKIGPQPGAWGKIDTLIASLDNKNNAEPAPIIIDENKIGINFANSKIKGIFKTMTGIDGNIDKGRGKIVYIKALDITPLNVKHSCPCNSSDDPDKIESFTSLSGSPFIYLIIFLFIVFIAIIIKENFANIGQISSTSYTKVLAEPVSGRV